MSIQFVSVFSNRRGSHEELLFKIYVHWERYLIFCLCYPILLDDVIDDMIYIINTDSMFTLDDVNVEEI